MTMSHRPLSSTMIFAAILLVWESTGLLAQDKSPATSRSVEQKQLATVLTSDGSYAEKLAACKRLALIGDKSSVAALAALLTDEKLSHAARIGLEAIPDPAATDALRHRLSEVQGELLIGVINSVGARGDQQAVPQLGQLLANSDPQVVSAVAAALGKIATPKAAQLLKEALATVSPTARPAIGQAALGCAETFRRRGDRAAAMAVYEWLRAAELPGPLRMAATRGEILTRGVEGAGLLAEELTADDDVRFAGAIGVSRELSDARVAAVLLNCLPKLSPERQALLIAVLGDRGDVAARPAVVAAAAKAPKQVRIAAVRALATLGDDSATPVLLKAAGQTDPEVAAAALDTLAVLAAPRLDVTVTEIIETADGKMRRVAVELAGRRQITSAVPALQKMADSTDEETRLAAITSLGQTIAPEQLPVLTERLLSTASDQERTVVENALKSACRRSVGKEACGRSLATYLPRASQPVRCFLIELLGSVGGSTALQAVSAAALDEDEAIQDVATRVLGEWPSPDAAPALLELTKKLPNGKYQIRALRGCIRILRQMDMPRDQRLSMCREAMQLAGRDPERSLVLEALGRIPSREAMALVTPHLQTPSLQKAASSAAVSIGEKIVSAEPTAVADAMRKTLQATTQSDLLRRARELLAQAETTSAATPSSR